MLVEQDCGCDIRQRPRLGLVKIVYCPMHKAAPKMVKALEAAVGAFTYQVTLCHARDAALHDKDIWARPMDYQELVANMYAATAEALIQARKALPKTKPGGDAAH